MRGFIEQKREDVTKLSLVELLESKPLYYSEIDYTRMPRAYESIKDFLHISKIIHLIGTNGKGTTGRFIANALLKLGKNVGHYSSPHIQEFNERIWLNGENVSEAILEKAHNELIGILSKDFQESLSFFEYTTFLAMIVFKDCDYIVLEAGLGGEHDATNVFNKELSVITPISMDHVEFLGNTVEKICLTKLRSVQNMAIIGEQKYKEVFSVIKTLENADKKFISYKNYQNPELIKIANELGSELNLPLYLKENMLLAMSVITELGYRVKKSLFESKPLEGRMQKIRANVWLDLGHNLLAAEAIKECFEKKSVNLVYNSYKDKDYLSILAVLKPIIKQVEIISIEDKRIVDIYDLIKAIEKNGLKYKLFNGIKDDENYLVFGSFCVASEFKKFI